MIYKQQFLSLFFMISIFSIIQNPSLNCDTSEVSIPVEVTCETFEKEILGAKIPVVLYIYELESLPCQDLHPIFAEMCQKCSSDIKFATMNLDKNESFADMCGVQNGPLFFVYYQGEFITEFEYFESQEELRQICAEILNMCEEIDAQNLKN